MLENSAFAYGVYLYISVCVLGAFEKLQNRLLASSYLSVRPSFRMSIRMSAWNNSAPTGRIFMKYNI
jgi:hypothetical protein